MTWWRVVLASLAVAVLGQGWFRLVDASFGDPAEPFGAYMQEGFFYFVWMLAVFSALKLWEDRGERRDSDNDGEASPA